MTKIGNCELVWFQTPLGERFPYCSTCGTAFLNRPLVCLETGLPLNLDEVKNA